MDFKLLREKLRELDIPVPRKNKDVVELYNRYYPDDQVEYEEPEPTKNNVVTMEKKEDDIYTYVGKGHEPPQVIKFMGLQVFKRGQPTKVTNPIILSKIKTHPCFVKGEVSGEMIIRQDEVENELYERKLQDNQIMQMKAMRNNR